MSDRWGLGHFLAVSVVLHTMAALFTAFINTAPVITIPQVIRVSIVADTAPRANDDFQHGKIMDAPPPKKTPPREMPEKADILASFDARARARKQGDGLALRPSARPEEMKVAQYAAAKRRHKQSSDSPKASGEVRTTVTENRFSEVELASAQHDKGGEVAPVQPDTRTKTERETKKEQRALSAEDVDSFAVSSPAGVLETDSEIVIPFNTRKFDYMEYFSSLRHSVESIWSYPNEAMESGTGGKALLRFTLDRSGNLDEVKVIATSGAQALDNAAVDAVRRSAPFKPFPDNLDKLKIHIVATFNYTPQYGKIP